MRVAAKAKMTAAEAREALRKAEKRFHIASVDPALLPEIDEAIASFRRVTGRGLSRDSFIHIAVLAFVAELKSQSA
jgi:hypothetical protein